jgi:hypothetical protein
MKITMNVAMDVDCTPDEARLVLGLPDMKPMQEALLKEAQQRLSRNIQLFMDPEAMMKTWLPAAWLPAALKDSSSCRTNSSRE